MPLMTLEAAGWHIIVFSLNPLKNDTVKEKIQLLSTKASSVTYLGSQTRTQGNKFKTAQFKMKIRTTCSAL